MAVAAQSARVLAALSHQQLRRSCASPGCALPACWAQQACLTTSCAALQQQQQLVRTKQQQHGSSTGHATPRSGRLWLAALGAGAAAGVAGWAACNLESSSWDGATGSSGVATQRAAARLAASSPRAQAAAAASVSAPLLHLLHGLNPTPAQLQGIAAALEAERRQAAGPSPPAAAAAAALGAGGAGGLGDAELADGLWGLAMLAGGPGAQQAWQQVAGLAAAAVDRLAQMPVYEAIITAWAVTMLCGSSSSDPSSSSSGGPSSSSSGGGGGGGQELAALSRRAWQQLRQRLLAASPSEYVPSEPCMLYLLHAAMQQAAVAAADSGSGPREQPRASLQELLAAAQLQELPRRVQQRLAGLYQEYVPFQPYVEGPLLVVLHLARVLPRYVAAAAAAAAGSAGSGGGPSPLVEVFGALSSGDAAAAAAVVSDPGKLSKLKRDLYFRWRSDELLDRHQRVVNEVVQVLHTRMQLPVQQPPDLDAVLPSLRAAVIVDERQQGPGAGTLLASAAAPPPASSPSSPSAAAAAAARAQCSPVALLGEAARSPPSPFTPPFWCEARTGLQQLARNRFAAPPGGFARRSCDGVAAARRRCLRARGWHAVLLGQGEVEAALGGLAGEGRRVKVGESPDHARLEALLRARLDAV